MSCNIAKKDCVSIVFSGEAGQGIETLTEIIVKVLKKAQYNVYSCKEYMSRVRGGTNSAEIRVSSEPCASYSDKIDFLVALSENSISHLKSRITDQTFVIYDESLKTVDKIDKSTKNLDPAPFTSLAVELGGKIFSNIISAGMILGMLDIEHSLIEDYMKKFFAEKSEEVVQKNIDAAKKGFKLGEEFIEKNSITISIQKAPSVSEKMLISGNDCLALGYIAGGCDFISSYPMSPSTGVLVYLSQKADLFNIIVEQAEDEIAAINMGLGAWYAGSRALVTSSGGGFALMVEGVSLAGMIETPIVINLAQRPGPATGLPTRTEQGDLNLVLYAGHGEFPRIILAPGTPEDAFYLAQNAFNLADKFQSPVFVLSDQHFLDSYFLAEKFDAAKVQNMEYISQTDKDYKRYKLTENGISPRGIPGFGEGLVKVDSDEHDEDSHITEDLDLRVKMQDKRMKKALLINKDVYAPELIGSENYKTLVVGWGSTCLTIKEALAELKDNSVAFLYYKQVYPLHEKTLQYLEKAEKTVCVEGNSTGQFAAFIRQETGFNIDHKVLKYNGSPFSVEEIVSKLKKLKA